MAFGERELVVRIVGDASSLDRTMKHVSRSANKFGKDISSTSRGALAASLSFRGLGRSLAFASAGFLGGFGLAAAVRSSFEEMSNVQKAAAQTQAVLKSTGGVAGVTADHVNDLASQLMNLSGVDDELIKNSENLLLTFRNIRNVVGTGNDIFDRAAKAALNLSVRFDTSLAGASVKLGRALQDPERGLNALSRSGVTFSSAQRKLIKNLVESGHVLEAQKLILGEVEVQTKGAAKAQGETLSGKLNLLRETVRNVAGTLADQLLPAITKVTDRALAWVTNVENQQRVLNAVKDVASVVAGVFGALRGAFESLNTITGSTKRTLELLLGALIAFKTAKLVGTLADVASSVGLIGTNAKTATGEAKNLRGALVPLTSLAIAVPIALVITEKTEKQRKQAKGHAGRFGFLVDDLDPRSSGFVLKDFQRSTQNAVDAFVRDVRKQGGGGKEGLDPLVTKLFRALFPTDKKPKVEHATIEDVKKSVGSALGAAWSKVFELAGVQRPGDVPKMTQAQGNALFDSQISRMLDRVQDAPLKGQVRKLQQIAVIVEERIAATKGIARKLELEDKLLEVTRQAGAARALLVQGLIDRLQFNVDKAGATKTASDDLAALHRLNAFLAKRIKAGGDTLALERQQFEVQQQISEVLKQQAEERKKQRAARQFRRLGFGPTGEDIVPGVKNLKRQLASVADAVKGSFLDTRKTRGLLAHIRQVLSGGLGSVSAEVRSKVQQLLADLREQLKKSSVDVTRFNKTARGQFVTAGAHGAGSGTITVQGGIHLHGIQNLKELEDALRKRKKQRAHQRGGAR